MIEHDLIALQALGQLETHMQDMADLSARLEKVPLWQPAHVLAKQAAEARRMMANLQARMDRQLVVTLIGPSGAGKSTLLNALAGMDDASPVGTRRPTTQDLVVLADDAEAVNQLIGPMDAHRVQIHANVASDRMSHIILVDTPDTDSTHVEAHIPLILQAVAHSDVLICVFDAQNPKRRDHADFMAPLVQRFNGAALVAVINKSDRLDETELRQVIGPEFEAYLQQAWDTMPQRLLFLSARRHLRFPQWEPHAEPRHELDQFDQLQRMIVDTFKQPGFGPDLRLANARRLRDFVLEQVHKAVAADSPALNQAAERILVAEREGMHEAMQRLRTDERRVILGVHARLYQSLAQRWVGPVGWILAIWSRLILFGTGVSALVRFGNPMQQLWGMASSWRHRKEGKSSLGALSDQTRIDTALQGFRKVWWTQWPDIAERLVQGRFDPQVRRLQAGESEQAGQLVRDLWSDALEAEIENSARGLSNFSLQLLLNLPNVGLLGYIAWLTAKRFLTQNYVSGDFFMHALLTIGVFMLLSFFVLQVLVRLAMSRDRLQRRAFRAVEKEMADRPIIAGRDIMEQVEQVLSLKPTEMAVLQTDASGAAATREK